MQWFRKLLPWLVIALATAFIIYLPDLGPEKYSTLDELFSHERVRQLNTGFSVTVTRNGAIILQKSYGADGLGNALASDTPMYLGPSSEILSGALLYSLSLQGEIELDRDIHEYLPEFSVTMGKKPLPRSDQNAGPDTLPEATQTEGMITIRQLASHSLALDEMSLKEFGSRTLGVEAGALDPEGFLLERIQGVPVSRNRLVYRILGSAMETATKTPFSELLESRLLIPFGMHGTTAAPDSLQGVAVGSGLFFGLSFPYESQVPYIAAPADGIVTTIEDIGKFLSYITAPPKREIAGLPPASISSLYNPLVPKGDTGYGWRILEGADRRTVYQGGSVEGFSSRVVLWPDQKTSIAILCAQGGVIQSNIVLPLLTSAAEDLLFEGACGRFHPLGRVLIFIGIALFVYVASLFLQSSIAFSWAKTLHDRSETNRGNLHLNIVLSRTIAGLVARIGLLAAVPLVIGRVIGMNLMYHDLLTMEPGMTALFIIAVVIGMYRNLARLIWFVHLRRG